MERSVVGLKLVVKMTGIYTGHFLITLNKDALTLNLGKD